MLVSNWPDLPPCPPRKTVTFVAIDVDNSTACICEPGTDYLEKARYYYNSGHDVEIRHVQLQEEDYKNAKNYA